VHIPPVNISHLSTGEDGEFEAENVAFKPNPGGSRPHRKRSHFKMEKTHPQTTGEYGGYARGENRFCQQN